MIKKTIIIKFDEDILYNCYLGTSADSDKFGSDAFDANAMEYVIENNLADDINEICKSFDFAKCNYIDTIDDGIVEIYLQIKDNAIDEPFYQLVEAIKTKIIGKTYICPSGELDDVISDDDTDEDIYITQSEDIEIEFIDLKVI